MSEEAMLKRERVKVRFGPELVRITTTEQRDELVEMMEERLGCLGS